MCNLPISSKFFFFYFPTLSDVDRLIVNNTVEINVSLLHGKFASYLVNYAGFHTVDESDFEELLDSIQSH